LYSDRGGVGVVQQAARFGKVPQHVETRLSLAVTDKIILQAFPFGDLMQQLAQQGGVDRLSLFHQWWDSEGTSPGVGPGPHCDDEQTGGSSTFNGFPLQCPRNEHREALIDPFVNEAQSPLAYDPIGLFNRFDLAPSDGHDCGEYRIVFARRDQGDSSHNLLIFEGVLPNPTQALGLAGCLPVAQMWGDLSHEPNALKRRDQLHDFYFNGLPGFEPVIHIDHYGAGADGRGQIRTNQFIQFDWLLREFKMRRACPAGPCGVSIVPATAKVNPFGPLFDARSTDPQASAFQAAFVASVDNLASADINRFFYEPANTFNTGQSDVFGLESNYVSQFGSAPNGFRDAIQARLTAIGSNLTPTNLVTRAEALSCAGCHQLSNQAPLGGGLTWPTSAGFTHISDRNVVSGPDGDAFQLSSALISTFLPHRKMVLEAFLTAFGPDQCIPQFTCRKNACGIFVDDCGNEVCCNNAINHLACCW